MATRPACAHSTNGSTATDCTIAANAGRAVVRPGSRGATGSTVSTGTTGGFSDAFDTHLVLTDGAHRAVAIENALGDAFLVNAGLLGRTCGVAGDWVAEIIGFTAEAHGAFVARARAKADTLFTTELAGDTATHLIDELIAVIV